MRKDILNDFEEMKKEEFNQLQQMMLAKHYVIKGESDEPAKNIAYYNAYLLSNFGIEITNPKELTKEAVREIANYFKLDVPSSFYSNPQDLKYFTKDELLIEKIVSYFFLSPDLTRDEEGKYNRIEIFKKELPEYVEGDDIKTRKFTVITEQEALEIGKKIEKNYCDYTRPFSIDEKNEFIFLYDLGLYDGSELKCRDNIFNLLDKDINFAKGLDRKDVVKYSKELFGENKNTFKNLPKEKLEIFKQIIPLVKIVPLSRTQAKLFNKICKECNIDIRESNEKSPYRLAQIEMEKGNIMGATEIFARNGSLLERNLVYLLSRANPKEQAEIIDKISDKNPIALYQMSQTLDTRDNFGRTFTFTKNNKTKMHTETPEEAKYSKTRLSEGTVKFVKDEIIKKIEKHYQNGEKIGKVYISKEFEKIALPVNTTTNGKGLDVMPSGSRTEINGDYIRTFAYWYNTATIIDPSAIFLKEDYKDTKDFLKINWQNYDRKPLGEAFLTSGDCTTTGDGAEYQDFKISELKELGYKYIVYTINGYSAPLNVGDIYAGYQDKTKLETKAWDAKNIEFRINIKGDAREYSGFAIDLETKEIITLNTQISSQGGLSIVNSRQFQAIEKYLNPSYLETMNMAKVIEAKATEIVDKPEDADIVFDRNYTPTEKQVVIRPFDVESLVSIVNDGKIELPEDKTEKTEKFLEVKLMDYEGKISTTEVVEGKEYTIVSHAGDLILLEGNALKDKDLQQYIDDCYDCYLEVQTSFVATKENVDAINSSRDSMDACYSVSSLDCENIDDDVE